mmetsp:Transcript_7174/g.8237  ORF Transcript_7174/g.8237 Transcript_7174/m.8237 type:complete len:171 (-) Transcript_7174:292-804(-)|eukprot:CAMPEP_0184010860 /NCGR_PEP_ID=MMETSP0954-20121128/3476_1 /TAXON_ID=627963 /ORGANISM="Aplanochytrium sp, Strain PBS07" /LENGTH=170 /DNA_ID=CAMNT_0026290553 /DNA_START=122 /DNA_END=634 /DNA_ORIENTATION=-
MADSNGVEKLCMAAALGRVEEVEKLINEGVPTNEFVSFLADLHAYDWTPLHAAANSGNLRIVQLIHETGVDLDACRVEKISPLILAADEGHTEIVKYLLKHGANVNHIDKYRRNAAHRAASNGHLDIIRLLVDAGVNVSLIDETGRAPIDMAAAKGRDSDEMKALLSKKK